MDADFRTALLACKRALTNLALLSDAPTGSIRAEGVTVHGTGTDRLRTQNRQPMPVHGGRDFASSVPVEVLRDDSLMGNGHAPSKQLSLYAHYLWRMKRAQLAHDTEQLVRLARLATRDYQRVVVRRQPSLHEDHESAVIELIRDWTGWEAWEVAIELKVDPKWVRRQRFLEGRDPATGEVCRLPERTEKVLALYREGMSQRQIAAEVGCGQATVSRILNTEAIAA